MAKFLVLKCALVLLSPASDPVGDQALYHDRWENISAKISEGWGAGQSITALTFGDKLWNVVLSTDPRISDQKTLIAKSSAELKQQIAAEWKAGYKVTSVAGDSGHWVVVVSKGAIDY